MAAQDRQPSTAIGHAFAKVILFGEHAVVYGQPALGMTLSRGVKVTLSRGSGQVTTRFGAGVTIGALPDGAEGPAPLVRAGLGDAAAELDTDIEISVPPGAGLGTSAAIAVALLRAQATLGETKLADSELIGRAIEIENVAHGNSSGLDPAICAHGGLVQFQRTDGAPSAQPLRVGESFHLVVGVFGTHGGTKKRVSGVADLHKLAPQTMQAAMQTLGGTTSLGARALTGGDFALAGRAMNLAHGVLSGLGLVGDGIEERVRLARNEGALGAKMSGAGGDGGAMVALVSDIQTAQAVSKAWQISGVDAWIETAT